MNKKIEIINGLEYIREKTDSYDILYLKPEEDEEKEQTKPELTQEERLEKIEKKLDRVEAIQLETAMQIIEPPSFDDLPEIPEGELPPLPDMNSLDPDLLKELMSGSIPELP